MNYCLVSVIFLMSSAICFAKELPTEAKNILAHHKASIARLKSIQAKVVSRVDTGDGTLKKMTETDWYRVGSEDRFSIKTYMSYGVQEKSWNARKEPLLEEYGYNPKEIRILSNWDQENHPKLPLKPGGKHAIHFARIEGSIQPRDPARRYQAVLSWLLLVPIVTQDLESLIENASEVDLKSTEEGPVFELKTDHGNVNIQLDREHGYLIKRCEWFAGDRAEKPVSIMEVTKFQHFKDKLVFPKAAVVKRGEKVVLDVDVIKLSLNEQLDSSLARVQFPEGARVNNPHRREIYVWGKDKPRLTFTSNKIFHEWEKAAAGSHVPDNKEVPRRNGKAGSP